MLQDSNTSKHNAMLGKKIAHPKSTNYDDDDHFPTPPPKRVKTGASRIARDEIPDSEDGSDIELLAEPKDARRTDLETALPQIETDKEAIEAYEASKAAEQAELGLQERLDGRKWTRGKTSIYVDAFNLALATVLEEESHLFDEAEHAVFKQWRDLTYEAQYLYVRLFLRKTSSWHRITRLGYHSDIADLPKAIEELQVVRDLPVASSQDQEHPGELAPPEGTTLGESFMFADRSQDCITTLEEASSLLLLDELKAIAKEVKVQGTRICAARGDPRPRYHVLAAYDDLTPTRQQHRAVLSMEKTTAARPLPVSWRIAIVISLTKSWRKQDHVYDFLWRRSSCLSVFTWSFIDRQNGLRSL